MGRDLNEVTVRRNQGTVEFRCVSTILSQEGTMLLQKFIEGALNAVDQRAGGKGVV